MRPIELLSPAKNLTCGIEAIRHGADAVYIGAERFGARAAAGNSIEDIAALCRFAHQFHAKVYVTVNTILYDEELEATRDLICRLYETGVDALIVQDLGLLKMDLPPIPLHASTQMDNQTPEKVAWLASQGYEQVVLARELPLEQIRAIHARCPDVRLEAFVHGALCVSYSGRCYASQHCFGRSANRGECAQFCRLAFDLVDANGESIVEDRHLLSLRDMNRADYLEEMIDAGVTSMKIEGRLKDVSYVKNITAFYRQRLDAIISRRKDLCRSSLGTSTYTFAPDPAKSFNRGFTDYFLHGRTSAPIWNFNTPKAMGEMVGHMKETRRDRGGLYIIVSSTSVFHNGDGFCFTDSEGHLQGFRINRAEGNHLYIQSPLPDLKKGTPLYRNYDAAFEGLLSKPSADRRIAVKWTITDKQTDEAESNIGFTFTLTEEDDTTRSLFVAHPHEPARTPQADNIRTQLTRLGNTIYAADPNDVSIDFSENWFLPSSLLSDIRRRLTEKENNVGPIKPIKPITPINPINHQPLTINHQIPLPSDYTANVSNRLARDFYADKSLPEPAPAYELSAPASATIMTCRHCLRYALGLCPNKTSPKISQLSTLNSQLSTISPPLPWSLRLPDGRSFPLHFDCKNCEMQVQTQEPHKPHKAQEPHTPHKSPKPLFSLLFIFLLLLTSCYNRPTALTDRWEELPEAVRDSIDFAYSHHYTVGYNFIVRGDSLMLLDERPMHMSEGVTAQSDSQWVRRLDQLVVAAITVIPEDSIDSVWVKVARDQLTMGWTHENDLLREAAPDDPISEFIRVFSSRHLIWFLIIMGGAIVIIAIRSMLKQRFRMLLYNDIPSAYPTCLTITLAISSVLYSYIQDFEPQTWVHFYFHPTLNPLAQPPILCTFLITVWLLMLLSLAVVQDVFRMLRPHDAVLYLISLLAICMLLYLLFSLLPSGLLTYLLCLAFCIFAVKHYWQHARARYLCGRCGMKLADKGVCPRCGAIND